MISKNKNIFYTVIYLLIFIAISLLYVRPIFQGKELIQHDIIQYKGGAKELLDYRENNGKETYWSNSMFGGMPTYQMGVRFEGDIIKQIDYLLNFLPRPANYLFLLFSGFFFLGWVATKSQKYALIGASFFGLSTYFYIIIAAGHNSKIHTIAYFAPLLAGILLVYVHKTYILGFLVTALFMGLQIAANHPQMTYYLFIAIAFLFFSELIRVLTQKTEWKHFGISSGILALAFLLGIGMNSQRIMANMEYAKETVRGRQILKSNDNQKDGINKDNLLMWSYGKLETLNLFIPRLMGGGSQEEGSDKIMENIRELIRENTTSQEELGRIIQGLQSPTYWGKQPGTAGPAYQGAVVCFLAFIGFFFAQKKYKYWILLASVLAVMLAWGNNLMILSDIFIDFIPLYNKFRAPSSILVIVELLFPLIAIIGLYRFFNDKNLSKKYKNKILLYVGGSIFIFTLFLAILGKSLFPFCTETEKHYLPLYILDYLIEERLTMFHSDILKTLFYISIVLIVLFLNLKNKVSQNIALTVIGLVSFFDLWTVNKRYLNQTNFTNKIFVQQPFITEIPEYLMDKAESNPETHRLVMQANMNKVLATITNKDKTNYRIFNTIANPFNETNTSYFKSSIGGYHAAKLRRYDDLINHYFSQTDTIRTPKILNMLNAKYWITGNYENPKVIQSLDNNGNAWFVSNIIFADNPNEEIDKIGLVDTKKTAVISKDDKNYFFKKKLEKDDKSSLKLIKYEPNRLEFKSYSKTPQLAVFSEIYYPFGWKIFIDDKPVPYIKANYLLRALHVPEGIHHIRMVFEPEILSKGRIISNIFFTVFLLVTALGMYLFYKNHKKILIE